MRHTQTHLRLVILVTAIIAATSWYALPNRFVAHAQNSEQASAPDAGVTAVTNGKIVFASPAGEIFTINPDGSGRTQLTNNNERTLFDNFPAYSRDGSQIVFTRNGRLWLMNADGTNQRLIVPPGRYGAERGTTYMVA